MVIVRCSDPVLSTRDQTQCLKAKSFKLHDVDCQEDVFVKGTAPKWGLRLKKYRAVADSMPASTLVMFIDTRDLLVLNSPAHLASEFQKLGSDLLFQCTDYEWPKKCPLDWSQRYREFVSFEFNATACHYPCGGGWGGPAEAVSDFLHSFEINDTFDDQCWMRHALATYSTHRWAFDRGQRIFSSARRMVETYRSGHPTEDFKGHPVFMHFDSFHPTSEELRRVYACRNTGIVPTLDKSSQFRAIIEWENASTFGPDQLLRHEAGGNVSTFLHPLCFAGMRSNTFGE